MRRISILFVIVFISTICVGQTKTKKKVVHGQLEIDRLYEKYKDKQSILIYYPGGSIEGEITTYLNDNGKPSEILISGKSWSAEFISEFLSYYIKQKVSKGFKEDGENTMSTEWYTSSIKNNLEGYNGAVKISFLKGNEYTIITYRNNRPLFDIPGAPQVRIFYYFSITTGDTRRIGGNNSKPFDF